MNWLVASRNYVPTYEAQKAHKWLEKTASMRSIHDQVGKKVGILGYGSIGRQSTYSSMINWISRAARTLPETGEHPSDHPQLAASRRHWE